MQIARFIEQGFPYFQGVTRKESINRFLYLERLAVEADVDISTWDHGPFSEYVDATKNNSQRARSKVQINGAFLAERKRIGNEPKPFEKKLISDQTKLTLQNAIKEYVRNYGHPREVQYNEQMQNAHENLEAYRNNLAHASKIRAVIDGGAGKEFPDLGDATETIINDGFFTFLDAYQKGQYLRFTTPDLIVSEVNKLAGIDITVNLGQVLVYVNTGTLALRVDGHKRNIFMPGKNAITPHVKYQTWDGICYGNAEGQYQELKMNRDLVGMLRLLQAILTSYGANPYATLQQFDEEAIRQRDAKMKAFAEAEGFEVEDEKSKDQKNLEKKMLAALKKGAKPRKGIKFPKFSQAALNAAAVDDALANAQRLVNEMADQAHQNLVFHGPAFIPIRFDLAEAVEPEGEQDGADKAF